MDSREQFEAWMAGASLEPVDGAYGRAFWKAWQASREALVVELPKKYVIDGVPVVTVAELKIRLDKAGIKWK